MIIHCDWCGCAFDPEKNAVCPHCGGAWDKDSEAARVRAEEERRRQQADNSAKTEDFIRTADTIRQTVGSIGRAATGIHRIFRVIFWILFLLAALVILFVLFRILGA